MAKVYQAINPTFGVAIADLESPSWPEGFQLVAETESDNLEEIFFLTNTIDSPWWENEGVNAIVSPCRSTSVGDIVEKSDGSLWYCDMMGWKPFTQAKYSNVR